MTSRNNFNKLLSNERYRGVYIYGDIRIEGGIPRIISDELFFKVQEAITTKKNPRGSRRRSTGDYLLTGKLFCGECRSPMTGISGTSKGGALHYYYVCQRRRMEKGCSKKNVRRDEIEELIAGAIKDYVLRDDVIEWIADQTVAYSERKEADSHIGILEDQLAETKRGIKNILTAIEQGIITPSTKDRLQELEREQAKIEASIATARADIVPVDRDLLVEWLRSLKEGDIQDKKYQARLFDTFLLAAYAYDDRMQITFTFSGQNEVTIPLEDPQEPEDQSSAECSSKLYLAPPKWTETNTTATIVMIGGMFVLSFSFDKAKT